MINVTLDMMDKISFKKDWEGDLSYKHESDSGQIIQSSYCTNNSLLM